MLDITAIIPVYNGEQTIKKCIDSLMSINDVSKIIVVNDGSTDKTGDILRSYDNTDGKLSVITTANKGVSSARNIGLDNVKSDYFIFVDADDYVTFEANIEYSVADLMVFNINTVHQEVWNSSFIASDYRDLAVRFGIKRIYGKIYSTSIINENKIKFDTSISFAEDYKFVCDYIRHIKSSSFIKGIDYIQEDVNTSSLSKKYMPNIEHTLDSLTLSINQLLIDNAYNKVFYKYYCGIEFENTISVINNLFKNGCPFDAKAKKEIIKSQINKYFKTAEYLSKDKMYSAKRKIDKLYNIILKTKCVNFIYFVFKMKFKLMYKS